VRIFLYIIIGLFIISGCEKEPAIIYGKNHVFSVKAPDGWVYDSDTAKKFGLVHLIYPKSEPKPIRTYMYAYGWAPNSEPFILSEFINKDIETYRKRYGDKVKFEIRDVSLPADSEFLTGKIKQVDFTNIPDEFGKYSERVIFIEARNSIVLLVFSFRSKEEESKYANDYMYIVKSFDFLGEDSSDFVNN